MKQITAKIIRDAVRMWPYKYQTEEGTTFIGLPVSQVPSALREAGWRNVPRVDGSDCDKLGLKIVRARYVGGACPKRYCDVVWCWDSYQIMKETPQ